MGKLILKLPDGATREYLLERERVMIGRRADNDICLPFPAVSGEHAAVVTILDDSFLEDLGSTNGTLVNGKPITKHFLRDHDEIDIGRHTLTYVSGAYVVTPMSRLDVPVAVTENGGATIGDDETTVITRARTSSRAVSTENAREVVGLATTNASESLAPAREEATGSEPVEALLDSTSKGDAPADAPALEVLDGPSAGTVVQVGREDFVMGRIGEAVAVLRRDGEGFRLLHVEGLLRATVNGSPLGDEGALLKGGDEIRIAGTRVVFRPAL
ncbi:MAG TPA: FHA domain-containing protein [Casimicrobiaceae bacterium]|nr:FHA domain-containing protein [Casimicrobiaceae bacterium]